MQNHKKTFIWVSTKFINRNKFQPESFFKDSKLIVTSNYKVSKNWVIWIYNIEIKIKLFIFKFNLNF